MRCVERVSKRVYLSGRNRMRILFLFFALFCIVSGRIHTYNLTEGQALVEGAIYWIGALCWGFLAWHPFRNKES